MARGQPHPSLPSRKKNPSGRIATLGMSCTNIAADTMLRLAKILQSRTAVVAISAAAVIGVAAATAGVVTAVAPTVPRPMRHPGPQGPFSRRHVVVFMSHKPHSYLGVYANRDWNSYAPVESFTAATDVRPNVALCYVGWQQPFNTALAIQASAHKSVLLVQIDPTDVNLAAIAAGVYDAYLERFANAVARFGERTRKGVIIGFGHEPNGPWYPWGRKHVDPGTWVAAWRHIVNVFRRQGADNVTWLWTVNIIYRRGGIVNPAPWWPGHNYVTWVGIDGYYYKRSWTFASLFGPTIKAVRALTFDPILVSETGVAPAAGQPTKIANLFAGIRRYGLLGFVWFDAKGKRDWRIDQSAAIAAFRRGAVAYKRVQP
jgi:mannan endo-1,4-beta-mannosidase